MNDLISPPPFCYAESPQVQRHEIARLRQFMSDLAHHRANMFQQLNILATQISTHEQQLEYVGLLQRIRETDAALESHGQALNQMLAMADMNFSRNLSDQAKREIYHLYHAGRYTQEQLAGQYHTSQTTVHRIVHGPAPEQLTGVNTNSLNA